MMQPWMLWTLAAVVQWAVWSLLSRSLEAHLDPVQSQALSTLGMIPVLAMLAVLVLRRGRAASIEAGGMQTSGQRWCAVAALAAGLCTCAGNVAYYRALAFGSQISSTISLTSLYPMVTVLLALIFLRERLGTIQWMGMGLSMGAIALLNFTAETSPSSHLACTTLIPILAWGSAGLLQKMATRHLSGESATFWFLAAFVPVGMVLTFMTCWPGRVPGTAWIVGILLGFFFSGGNLALLMAYEKGGKASIIAPLASLYPMMSVPAAILLFSEKVDLQHWLGIGTALAAVLALSREPAARTEHREA